MDYFVNILIVDDKQLDRDGIIYLINHYNLPLNPITAASANQALDELSKQPISILFTDISMPEVSGLELISKSKELFPDIKVVIFSSHENFDYAREAVDLGVYKYLLKPLKVDKFIKCMNELIEKIQNEKIEKISNVYFNIIMRRNVNKDISTLNISNSGYLSLLNFSEPFFNQNQFNLTAIKGNENIINVPINEYQCVFISSNDDSMQSLINFLKRDFKNIDNKFLFLDGGEFKSYSEMQDIYSAMEEAVPSFFLTHNLTIKLSEIKNSSLVDVEYIMNLCNNINKFILRKEREHAIASINKMFLELKQHSFISTSFVKYICFIILQTQFSNNNLQNNQLLIDYISEIDLVQTIEELKNICIGLSQGTAQEEQMVIEKALDIIHKHYMENISLESIASSISISTCYLSYLFKKTVGENFIKYLTSYRVEAAKDLLRSTKLKVGAICEMVGYSNVSYFSQVFKNHCGMTPAQFRGDFD